MSILLDILESSKVITVRRLLFGFLFFVLINLFVAQKSKEYLKNTEVPPSFRHMDSEGMDIMLIDYLKSKNLNAKSILVFGDCVTFGHGVKKSYVNYLPGNHVMVNVSMQEFPHSLFLSVMDYARERGVKKFVYQLHPFQHYFNVPFFVEIQNFIEKGDFKFLQYVFNNPDSLSESEKSQLFQTIRDRSRRYFKYFGPFPKLDQTTWERTVFQKISIFLKRSLHYLPLYHYRFIIDDRFGFKRSIFSDRQNRRDNYRVALSDERQKQILKKMNYIFKKYSNRGGDEFLNRLNTQSGLKFVLEYLKFHELEAAFFMSPTFSKKVVKYTDLTQEDWDGRVAGFKKFFEQYPFQYLDLSSHPKLLPHMRHYDNITVEGHKVLSEILSAEIAILPR